MKIEKQKFWIQGKETFLYGGEFHYFRSKESEWDGRLAQMKRAGLNLVSTYIPWRYHEVEEGRIDLDGSGVPEKNLKKFLRLVQNHGFHCIVRPGPYIMAEVKNEGIPGWLIDGCPEVLALDMQGNPHPTKVVSYLHPVFLQKAKKWYEAVCEVIAPYQTDRGGPVIMFQLDNEIAMLHWVTGKSDFHPLTVKMFIEQLRNSGGTAAGVPAEDEIPQLVAADMGWYRKWAEFKRSYMRAYVEKLKTYAQGFGISVPFLVNVHGFKDFSVYSRGTEYPVGLSQLYEAAHVPDVLLAGDFYPGHIGYDTFHDLVLSSVFTKSVQPAEHPLFSAEFQSGRLADRPRVFPQDLDLNTRTCLASGMNALNYYMFAGGENYDRIGLFGRRHEWQAPIDSAGGERPSYAAARHLGRLLACWGTELLNAERTVDTVVGFNADYYWVGEAEGRVKEVREKIAAETEHFAFDGIYRMLIAANYSVAALDLKKNEDIDAGRIPSLWVNSTAYMDEGLQRRLLRYVQAGGRLILFPTLPLYDMDGGPCRVLADGIGLDGWQENDGMFTVDILDYDEVYANKFVRFDSFEGETIARADDGTIGFIRELGEGRVMVLGAGMVQQYNYQLDLIRKLAEKMGIGRNLSLSEDGAIAAERKGRNGSFLFVNNYDEAEKSLWLKQNGGVPVIPHEVKLAPRSGLLLPYQYSLAEGCKLRYSTVEIIGVQTAESEIRMTVRLHADNGMIGMELGENWRLAENLPNGVVSGMADSGNELRLTGQPGDEAEIVLQR